MADNYGKKWNRDETILALSFYYETPYGKINRSNKYLQQMAQLMGRSLSSLIMKMVNLASFDDTLLKRGVTSLPHASLLDKLIWEEFSGDYSKLVFEKERILSNYTGVSSHTGDSSPNELLALDLNVDHIKNYTKVERIVLVRQGQNFFRKAVMSAYSDICCMTGIAIPELLQACHIMPWSKCKTINDCLNPANGLCMNYLCHKAFDTGMITVDKKTKQIRVSTALRNHPRLDMITKEWIVNLDAKSIMLPERNAPNLDFLEYHNDCVFIS